MPADDPTDLPVPASSRFPVQEIDQGLIALVMESGNSRRAAKRLKEAGVAISARTLCRWYKDDRYADKVAALERDVLPQLKAEAARRHSDMADRAMEVEEQVLELLGEAAKDLPARDLSTAGRNVATQAGIHRDKAALLRGDGPAPPNLQVNFLEMGRALEAQGAHFYNAEGERVNHKGELIEGTAKERKGAD